MGGRKITHSLYGHLQNESRTDYSAAGTIIHYCHETFGVHPSPLTPHPHSAGTLCRGDMKSRGRLEIVWTFGPSGKKKKKAPGLAAVRADKATVVFKCGEHGAPEGWGNNFNT